MPILEHHKACSAPIPFIHPALPRKTQTRSAVFVYLQTKLIKPRQEIALMTVCARFDCLGWLWLAEDFVSSCSKGLCMELQARAH